MMATGAGSADTAGRKEIASAEVEKLLPTDVILTVPVVPNVKVPRRFQRSAPVLWLTRIVVSPPACVMRYGAAVVREVSVVHHADTWYLPGVRLRKV